MATVPVKLVWKDNSTGVQDETGQEIDIYTDSPSFKPEIPINYAEARHPWMRLPAIASGEVAVVVELELPVTFVIFRVRQYNANGPGQWSVSSRIEVTNPHGTNTPPAPTQLGGAVVSSGDPPPPPPVDPPPPPPPSGGGGASSNYNFVTQFSGVQGANQWSYLDENDVLLVYSAVDNIYRGLQPYQSVWQGGIHPGGTVGTKVRFTAPFNGTALISGTAQLVTASNGVTRTVSHNAAVIDGPTSQTTTAREPFTEVVVMTAGEYIDFLFEPNSGNTYCSVALDIALQFTTDGSTPANPVISSLVPSTMNITTGGEGSLVLTLTSAAIENASVTVVSSDAGKASVPATVTVPLGHQTAIIPVTAVAIGGATITATYAGVAKQSTIAVLAPVSATWANAPIGGVVLTDWGFSGTASPLAPGMTGGSGNGRPDSDAAQPLSPPACWVSRLEIGTNSGGSDIHLLAPPGVKFREMYAGLIWRTNPQWTGRLVTDKMMFLRGADTNGLIVLNGGTIKGGNPYVMFTHNTGGGLDNSHIMSADFGLLAYPNVGPANIVPGVWAKIEFWIKCSTTKTSRDGAVKWWVNDVLAGHYEQFNYGTAEVGLNEWVWTETWDGFGVPIQPVPLEHWLGHLYVVGKN